MQGVRIHLDHLALRQIKRLHFVRVQPAVLVQIFPLRQQQNQLPDGDVELIAGMPLQSVELIGMPPAQADLLVQTAAVGFPQLRCFRNLVQFRGRSHILAPRLRERDGLRRRAERGSVLLNHAAVAPERRFMDGVDLNMGICRL